MLKIPKIINALSKTERYCLGGAILIFAVSSILFCVRIYADKTIKTPISGGHYVEGAIGQPIAINPVIAHANDVDRDLTELIFANLLELIDNYQLSEDKKTWTIYLKENLKWDDGEPFTADDIVFTIETIQDPNARSPLFSNWQGAIAERLSQREIRLTLKSPYAFFAENLRELKIMPKHIFSSIPAANLKLSDYNLEPVGNGPYKFHNYLKRKDGFITEYNLIANPNYYNSQPFIKELSFKFLSSEEELFKAFDQKEIDGLISLNHNNLKNIKINYQNHKLIIPHYYAIFFNANTNPALKEKNVRAALNYATDKNKIVNSVFEDRAAIIDGPIIPGIEGYDYNLYAKEGFSLETAKQILESDNWQLDDDGIRSKTINKVKIRLNFDIIVPQIKFLIDAVDIIRNDWLASGIKLNPIILDLADINNEIIKTRNYQMIIFGNILKNNPDIFSFWHSSERFYPGLNLALYNNKSVDNLLESIRKDFDANSRKQNLIKLQTIINQDHPAIFLFASHYIYIMSKNLGGAKSEFIATPSERFKNVNQWYLKTARTFK